MNREQYVGMFHRIDEVRVGDGDIMASFLNAALKLEGANCIRMLDFVERSFLENLCKERHFGPCEP